MAGWQEGARCKGAALFLTLSPSPPPSLSPLLALQGNVFLQTQLAKRNEGREALEAEWRAQHKALQ